MTLSAAQTPNPPPACTSEAHRQFDFWVGRWDVYAADPRKVAAHSLVERLYDGCALREHWTPRNGTPGGSLNSYRPDEKKWRQVWTDAGNELHDYRGGWTGSMMDLSGEAVDPAGTVRKVRMTFAPQADGSVVQTGYKWVEPGGGWEVDYKLTYRRAKGRAGAPRG